ncbi:hypothetical protein JAAARDRAFT_190995 [Jaapia argillacea MUCL 33604]|uniref:UEV domain-containing protein n=1 Tax=Jaapia argillacea MUCL 33604 TaxID=933084 RepID=A0A067Q1J4_9AGAM|nr:hypothetical protein JAAARDRAFT_190995 [Jaapia argillacea MUCL 33604]
MSETLTQKWLRQNLQSYPSSERLYADVNLVLSRYPTIRPKTDVYTYDDGRTQLLLCIHGLLPIIFRQNAYNIPVAVWITHEYPRQPPIAYVVPTGDMLVKSGKYMDISGRCGLPYLRDWERKSEGCNLASLLEAMQQQFSSEPPVYARPKAQRQAPHLTQTPNPNSSVATPPPTNYTPPSTSATNDRPPLPPKPSPAVSPSRPSPVQASEFVFPARVQSPALPPRPPPGAGLPQYLTSPDSPSHNRSFSIGGGNLPANAPFRPPGTPPPTGTPRSHRWSMPPQQTSPVYHRTSPPATVSPQAPASNPHNPPPPPQLWSARVPAPPPPPAPVAQAIPPPNLLDNEISSSLTNMHTVVPPRSMNPELVRLRAQVHAKLQSELSALVQVMSLDGDRLRAHQVDLLAGEPAIRDEMARLEAVRDVCRTVASRFKGVVEHAEKNVSELRRKGDPEVDELICSTTIVHNQLIDLVAEDNSIEDTIYHLHRALNTGRIDLERFLRATRTLAEEQFMKKALIEKIQTGMPMGQWT